MLLLPLVFGLVSESALNIQPSAPHKHKQAPIHASWLQHAAVASVALPTAAGHVAGDGRERWTGPG